MVAVLGAGAFGATPAAAADDPPELEVSLSDDPTSESPWRYVMTLRRVGDGPAEVVTDRRLLEIEVREAGSRRGWRRCRHPEAPTRVDDARVRTLATEERYQEWVDLRMYCWSRLSVFEKGAEMRVAYGFRSRGRNRFVVRRDVEGETKETARRVTYDGVLTLSPIPEPEPPEGAIAVDMGRVSRRTGDGVTFRLALRAQEEPTRVYLRDDMLGFRISGPVGEVECSVPHQPIAPIVDFFRRVTPRRATRTSVLLSRYCTDGFPVAGIYEVVPFVTLVYDGARYGLEAPTGTFEGAPVPVRIRVGDTPYVEQTLSDSP